MAPKPAKQPKVIPPHKVTTLMVANGGLMGLTSHIPVFLKSVWPAALILGAATSLQLIQGPEFVKTGAIQIIVDFLLLTLVGMILLTSFSVSWRRYLILGTPPSCFYFGRGFWSYLGRTTLAVLGYMFFFLIVFGVLLTLMQLTHFVGFDLTALPKPDPEGDNFALFVSIVTPMILISFISFIPSWWWLARHMPYFTAKAIEDDSVTWRGTFPLMKGNVWPYIFGAIMAALPLGIFQGFANMLAVSALSKSSTAIEIMLGFIVQLTACGWVAISASVGVTLYKRVIKNEPVSNAAKEIP